MIAFIPEEGEKIGIDDCWLTTVFDLTRVAIGCACFGCYGGGDCLPGGADETSSTSHEEQATFTQLANCCHIMAHKQHRTPALRHLPHLPQTLPLELRIPHRQHLVDQQDLRLQVGRDRE